MNNRFGVCEWSLPFRGEAAIKMAANIGFDGIQLGDLGGSPAGFPLLNAEVQERYRALRDELGIAYQALHLYTLVREGGMIHPFDSEQGRSAKLSIDAGIAACAELKIPALMLTSGFGCRIEDETGFARFGNMLRYACDCGDERGVRIVFESILQIDEIMRMRDRTGGRLFICYDIFNPIRFGTGRPLIDLARLDIGCVDHFHLKDAPDNAEGFGCTLLGRGCGEFAQVAARIRALGYKGWFVSENYYAKPPMNALGKAEELAYADIMTMKDAFER